MSRRVLDRPLAAGLEVGVPRQLGAERDAARAEQIELVTKHAIGGVDDRGRRVRIARAEASRPRVASSGRHEERRVPAAPARARRSTARPRPCSSARSVSRCGYTRAHGCCSCAAPISIRRDASWRGVFLEARRTRLDEFAHSNRKRVSTAAMRSAAWPSHSSGIRFGAVEASACSTPATMSCGLRADDAVGAVGDGHRPLGVFAQRQAGNAERGRFLLQTAGVGEDQAARATSGQEVDVAERLGQDDAVEPVFEAELAQPVARARMDRKHHRHLAATCRTALEDAAERLAVVDIRRPMQRQDRVRPVADRQCDRECGRASPSADDAAACRSSRCRRGESAPPARPRRAGSRRRRATASAADRRADR